MSIVIIMPECTTHQLWLPEQDRNGYGIICIITDIHISDAQLTSYKVHSKMRMDTES